MCKLCNNEYNGLKSLSCCGCHSLTHINTTNELTVLWIKECLKLKYIKADENLDGLYILKCPELIYIQKIKTLSTIYIKHCPKLMYAPIANRIVYRDNILSKPFQNCEYLTSDKMNKLYNNIYYLWTAYRIKKYSQIKDKINEDTMIKIIEFIIKK